LKITITYLTSILCCLQIFACAQTPLNASSNSSTASGNSNDTFLLERTIRGDFNAMEIDILNNLYLITVSNQLKKISSRGDSIAVFNDVKKFGNPSLIDVTNPLKVLLYYKNFATVVMLDRLLSPRNSINFRQQQIFSVKAIATSYDNNVWLFDEQDLKLKKIDENGKILQETTDWRLIMDEVPSPQNIIDANNFVYLYDPAKGFYVFDYYGTYKNNLPFLHWENIAISGNRLTGFSNRQFFSYGLQTLQLKTYNLPPFLNNYSSIKAMNGKLYLLKKEGIEIYTIL
jgi:hypothetical protein